MKAFLLTIQIYDVSSHQLVEVETSVHSCLESAEDIIYEIKDLLDDLELKINPEDSYDDESEDEDLDIDEEEDEEE